MRRLLLILLLSLPTALAAQQRHTITHEDVFLMKRIGGPAISPDGRWIVFSVTEPSYTEGEQVSDLSPLRSMPLTYLQLDECEELHDLSPLADCKHLQYLSLPPHYKDLECLRALPDLRYLGPATTSWAGPPTAAEFWKQYDAKKGTGQNSGARSQ